MNFVHEDTDDLGGRAGSRSKNRVLYKRKWNLTSAIQRVWCVVRCLADRAFGRVDTKQICPFAGRPDEARCSKQSAVLRVRCVRTVGRSDICRERIFPYCDPYERATPVVIRVVIPPPGIITSSGGGRHKRSIRAGDTSPGHQSYNISVLAALADAKEDA